ncbi:ferritin-like domain-containing protein [Kitasatospora sp. NPDC094015]|uniref:ferritin-like domain-containing protein n=1 Tax=Kitasatospora sp. NPDC094015 TaxID=3155205 RepID=UPI00332D9E4D
MLSPTRRAFLILGALAGSHLLCACTGGHHEDGDGEQHRADQDLPLRTRAVAATDALLAGYDGVLAGPGAAGRADLLKQLRAEVVQHRAALAEGLPTATGTPAASAAAGSPTTAPATTAPPASAPASTAPVTTVAALAAAERQTATARLADLAAASPALAKLLASVSAAGAVHAGRLGDTGPVGPATAPATAAPSGAASPTGPTTAPGTAPTSAPAGAPAGGSAAPSAQPSALPSTGAAGAQSALAAEHAAVYGYGVVCAFLPVGKPRDDGRTDYLAHQARRDGWQRLLGAGGASPTPAAAGYRLPLQVKDGATAGQLAAHIETRLTTVYADLVGTGTGPLRLQAADALRESALRAQHWGAEPPALPGLPAPAIGSPSGSVPAPTSASAAASPSH